MAAPVHSQSQRSLQMLAEKGGSRVLAPTHPGFDGTPRPDGLNSVASLAALYSGLLDDLGLEDVTVIGNSVGGWIAAEMALSGSPRISGLVLLDAVGIEVEGHPVADVSGLSVPEIQALSFHDPAPFRVDPSHPPRRPKGVMAANGAALAVYAGSPAMADPTCSTASAPSPCRPWCCGATAIRSSSPPTARPTQLPSPRPASRCCRPPGTCPRWRPPILWYRRFATGAEPQMQAFSRGGPQEAKFRNLCTVAIILAPGRYASSHIANGDQTVNPDLRESSSGAYERQRHCPRQQPRAHAFPTAARPRSDPCRVSGVGVERYRISMWSRPVPGTQRSRRTLRCESLNARRVDIDAKAYDPSCAARSNSTWLAMSRFAPIDHRHLLRRCLVRVPSGERTPTCQPAWSRISATRLIPANTAGPVVFMRSRCKAPIAASPA